MQLFQKEFSSDYSNVYNLNGDYSYDYNLKSNYNILPYLPELQYPTYF